MGRLASLGLFLLLAGSPLPVCAQGRNNSDEQLTTQSVQPTQIAVATGSIFRVDGVRYQIAGMRSPRVNRAQCFYEKRRGRAAQRALRRLLARGPIEITRTGGTSASGTPLVKVAVNGQDIRQRMIGMGYARPRTNQRTNPWCAAPGISYQ